MFNRASSSTGTSQHVQKKNPQVVDTAMHDYNKIHKKAAAVWHGSAFSRSQQTMTFSMGEVPMDGSRAHGDSQ